MKYIFAILLLGIGFASGWFISNERMNQKIEEKFPSEMEEALAELTEMIGPMTEGDVHEVMEQIQAFGENALSEFDQMSLWEGKTSYQFLNIEKEEGIASAKSFARSRILNFRDNYERGMKVGAWSEMADTIYENTNHLKVESAR